MASTSFVERRLEIAAAEATSIEDVYRHDHREYESKEVQTRKQALNPVFLNQGNETGSGSPTKTSHEDGESGGDMRASSETAVHGTTKKSTSQVAIAPDGLTQAVPSIPTIDVTQVDQYRPQFYEGLSASAREGSMHNPSIPETRVPGESHQFVPDDRSLPNTAVTEESIDEAYAGFILYCNPSLDLSTDTSELRRVFRSPPRSDGKTFDIFRLYQLICKLEDKEDKQITTWVQLAIELGVEPPDLDKNQSSQKIQQYSVRLKRWMRAMHVDSFFAYLMGIEHSYYLTIPPPSNTQLEERRDNVSPEEDLALRALLPETRPKRGRRKAEDRDGEVKDSSQRKRPHLDTTVTGPDLDKYIAATSAAFFPSNISSSQQGDLETFENLDTWASTPAIASAVSLPTPHIASATSTQFRWRPYREADLTPATPHPNSAITPSTAHSLSPRDDLIGTINSSKTRNRRRYGPAVSSAWSNSRAGAGGKLRGRPPSNRSVRNGPFSTFPANPQTKEAPIIDLGGISVDSAPNNQNERSERTEGLKPRNETPRISSLPLQLPRRLPGLQLLVPPTNSGPVRLATPAVYVNGEKAFEERNLSEILGRKVSSGDGDDLQLEDDESLATPLVQPESDIGIPFDWIDLEHALAMQLLIADFDGLSDPLTPRQANLLARSMLSEMIAQDHDRKDSTLLRVAVWLDALIDAEDMSDGVCALYLKNLKVTAMGEINTSPSKITKLKVNWEVQTGFATSRCELSVDIFNFREPKINTASTAEPIQDGSTLSDNESITIPKTTYLIMQAALREQDQVARMKRRLMQTLY